MTDASLPIPERNDAHRPLSITRQSGEVRALFGGHLLASSDAAVVVRVQGQPAVYYFPEEAVEMAVLRPNDRESRSPHFGEALWFTLYRDRHILDDAAWSYRSPLAGAEAITRLIAFNPEHVDIETDEAQLAAESPAIDDYIRHTDSGAGVSQAQHWDPTVGRPGDGA